MRPPKLARSHRISLLYASITAIWIVLSDRLLTLFTGDAGQQMNLQTIKGLLFIAFTASFIYIILRRELQRQETTLDSLRNSEAQWRSLAENATDVIVTVNRQGEILYSNVELLSGPASLKSVFDLIPSEYRMTGQQALKGVFETGEPASYEMKTRHRNGSPAWFSTRLSPIKHGDHIHAVLSISRDISDLKQAEAENQYALNTVQSIVDASPLAIIHLDPDGIVKSWNAAAETMFGWSAAEAIGRVLPYVPTEQQGEFRSLRKRVLEGNSFHGVEAQRQRKNGQEITISISTAPMRDNTNHITGIVAAIDDITERKAAERALALSEEKYRLIVESAQEGIWLIDADNVTTFVNARMAEMLGYTVGEMLGQPLSAFMDAKMWERAERNIQRRLKDSRDQREFVFRRKDGTLVWTFLSSNWLFDEQGNYCGGQTMVTDISALKQAQEAEREQRLFAEALAQTAQALISALDLDAVMNTLLDNIAPVVPHTAANIMLVEGEQARVAYWKGYGEGFGSFAEGYQFSIAETPNLQFMQDSGAPFLASHTKEFSGWIALPPTEWVQSYIAVPIRSHGSVLGFLNLDSDLSGYFTDVHAQHLQTFADQASIAIEHAQLYEQIHHYAVDLERRVAERTTELNHAKKRMEAILNSSPDAIVLCQMNGRINQANPTFRNVFGHDPDESLYRPLADLITSEDTPRLEEAFQSVQETQQPQRLEVRARGKEQLFEADVSLSLVTEYDELVQGVVCIIRDISTRKKMEAELRAALAKEKELNDLKTRFVGMVSHDVRTPLAVISSSTDMLRMYHDRLDEAQRSKHLDRIEAQTQRMLGLLDDVLTISRVDYGETAFYPKTLDLDEYCQQLIDEYQNNPSSDHTIFYSPPGIPLHLPVDEKLLYHALSNLLNNAIKYSPKGSTVSFELLPAPENAIIRIADTGIGIPEEDLTLLFTTFHRADNVGDIPGTGLGLAIVKQSVEAHGGAVTCESQLGVGTTFTITLPRNEREKSIDVKDSRN